MLLASVNESLYSQGFTRQSLDARAKGSNAGTFSILYRKGADGLAIITGSMEHGDVSSVLGQSNTALNTTQPLAENTTFQSYDLMAKEREFAMSETLFERSLTGSIVNMTYTDKDGKKAYLNSTTFLSNITCISFAYETGPVQSPRVLLILAIAAAMIGAGWVVYRRYFKGKMMKMQPDPTVEAPGMAFDHREKARILLEKAETAYRNQDYPTAYGLAGQAIRLFLAYEYGARTEMTNSEILAFMSKKGGETGTVKKILGTCSDIGFARGIPSEGEFDLLVRQVREIVGIS
jgi:hypothetical protein